MLLVIGVAWYTINNGVNNGDVSRAEKDLWLRMGVGMEGKPPILASVHQERVVVRPSGPKHGNWTSVGVVENDNGRK